MLESGIDLILGSIEGTVAVNMRVVVQKSIIVAFVETN